MSSRASSGDRPAAAGLVVVHSSDLHVDDGYTARAYGGDGTSGLRNVLATARALTADVVLLVGDVFEHNRLGADVLDRVARLLDEAGMPVVILPGNHDPVTPPDSVYHRGALSDPGHVHILGVTHDEAVEFAHLELEVWGHAHRDYGNMAPLRAPRARTTRWQIAMAHGHYEARPDGDKLYHPSWLITDEEIAATGADYVALGHWNRPVRVGNGTVPAYYSGSPELAKTVNVIRLGADGTVEVERHPIEWDVAVP